ncbi:hypothetical protein, partial [Paraglaciecola hydrolytica]|uniref:hypothetical protein n=1 Tax=Paraglaciecola hydrolytica TaxID=1799789 RepID=UPI00138F5334
AIFFIFLFWKNIFVHIDNESKNNDLDHFGDLDRFLDSGKKEYDLNEVAKLFGIEYVPNVVVVTDNELLGDIPVSIKSIIIIDNISKVKIEANIGNVSKTYNLLIGDFIEGYELADVTERYVRFSKNNVNYTVKAFKPMVLSELPEK